MKNPHDYPQLKGRVWEDCNKILLATLSQFIDMNIVGWEHVHCLQCDKGEEECKAPCPVALAIQLRDAIK